MKKLFLILSAVMALSVPTFASSPYFSSSPFSATSGQLSMSCSEVFPDKPVYFFVWNGYVEAITSSDGAQARWSGTDSSGQAVDTRGWISGQLSPNYPDLKVAYLFQVGETNISTNPLVEVFSSSTSADEIGAAFEGYLLNPSPEPSSPIGKFSVPCGNVAYFQVATSQTVNFKSVYQILSRPFANSTYGYWSDSGQRFGSASGLPTSSTSYPLASQSALYWFPDSQSKNLLGLSKTGLASSSCSAGQWYAFYNPAYNSNNTDFTTMDITGATVSISGSFSAVKIYPLEQVVDYQNGAFVGSSNDGYSSYYDGTIGEDGNVTFTDQNGNAGTPTAGGQNLLAPNETYQSIIDKVVGLLQNIVSEIKNLFSFGYEAINDLAGLMSNFGRALSGLYSWLPSEVHAALISAVSIAIVIGVFKVFI